MSDLATNQFFNNYDYVPEQNLLEELSIEAIQIYGLDVTYVQRTHVNIDPLFLEDPLSRFEKTKVIEMQIKNYYGYGGMSDMFSKFGDISTNDKLTLTVARKRWSEEFPDQIRPNEGDLIFIPMTKAVFEIKYVEHEDAFYQQGKLYYFDLECERFTYSNETFDTGVEALDRLEDQFSFDTNPFSIEAAGGGIVDTEDGNPLQEEQLGETSLGIDIESGQELDTENHVEITKTKVSPKKLSQNDLFQIESEEIIDFTEDNPYGRY